MKSKLFTYDWFSQKDHLSSWLAPYKDTPVVMIEVGCFEGRSTLWFVENILTHQDSRIICIDTFEGSEEHKQAGISFSETKSRFCFNLEEYGHKVDVFDGHSGVQLRFFREPVDIVYIDGSHQARDVLEDSVLAWRLLKPGGTLIWDDYLWPGFPEDKTKSPKLAIDAFLSVYAGTYEIIAMDYHVAIRKLTEYIGP